MYLCAIEVVKFKLEQVIVHFAKTALLVYPYKPFTFIWIINVICFLKQQKA